MLRVSPKSANQQNEMALTIWNSISVIVVGWWETGNWKVYEMVRTFRRSVPKGKRGLPLEVLYNLWSDFPQNVLFHFTFNRNFWIILLNGKHPNFPENLLKNCILPRDGSPLFLFRTEQWKFPNRFLNLPLPVSHLPKTIATGKRHLVWPGFLIFEKL